MYRGNVGSKHKDPKKKGLFMKAKNDIVLEVEKEDRIYRFSMPVSAPLGEAYEVVGAFMDEIVRLINEHHEKNKKTKDEKKDKSK
ncbi:MAG: hypothetical protein K1000chlam2_00005 [Chlamydiae bacterium]|nr:hypothetical protein [Chlamydiota bacterium]